jgi:hypothetical protein
VSGRKKRTSPWRPCCGHGDDVLSSAVRSARITGMAAMGTVAGIVVVSAACHSAGSVAATAITVIGGISGAVTGVAASAVRSVRHCGQPDPHHLLDQLDSGEQRAAFDTASAGQKPL